MKNDDFALKNYDSSAKKPDFHWGMTTLRWRTTILQRIIRVFIEERRCFIEEWRVFIEEWRFFIEERRFVRGLQLAHELLQFRGPRVRFGRVLAPRAVQVRPVACASRELQPGNWTKTFEWMAVSTWPPTAGEERKHPRFWHRFWGNWDKEMMKNDEKSEQKRAIEIRKGLILRPFPMLRDRLGGQQPQNP